MSGTMEPIYDWRSRLHEGRYRPCLVELCSRDSSDRYDVPLCHEHVLSIWAMVDEDMRAYGMGAEAVEAGYQARRPQSNAIIGIIYCLRIGDYIKIGWTGNLERRLGQYPPNAKLLAWENGSRKDERELHRRFSAYLASGREWFNPASEILAYIAERNHANGGKPVSIRPKRQTNVMKVTNKSLVL